MNCKLSKDFHLQRADELIEFLKKFSFCENSTFEQKVQSFLGLTIHIRLFGRITPPDEKFEEFVDDLHERHVTLSNFHYEFYKSLFEEPVDLLTYYRTISMFEEIYNEEKNKDIFNFGSTATAELDTSNLFNSVSTATDNYSIPNDNEVLMDDFEKIFFLTRCIKNMYHRQNFVSHKANYKMMPVKDFETVHNKLLLLLQNMHSIIGRINEVEENDRAHSLHCAFISELEKFQWQELL